MTRRAALAAAVLIGASAAAGAPSAAGATRDVWVKAEPVSWNIVPNERDAVTGTTYGAAESVTPTIVYRRYSRGWGRPLPNMPRSSTTQDLIPGPLIRARTGDTIRVHFKNGDTLYRRGHSMHFHGVGYAPGSDGAYIPGLSGPGGDVAPGRTFTYVLHAGRGSAGAWPYHDHSTSMHESIAGGLYGMLSIMGPREPIPDREFVVVFAAFGRFQTIDGRAFVGNTPAFRARPGELVQWDVMGMGDEHHTFHVHGHRWRQAGGVTRDTHTVGPAESFRFRWREDAPGTWYYHCHVEAHMAAGMIGTYQVAAR